MKLSSKQNEYIREAHSRWNLKEGAVRSGKSYVDVAYVILRRIRAVKDKDGLNVILGVSRETVERNILQPMREIYTDKVVGTINSKNIAVIAGCEVYCLGAEKKSQVSKIQGSSIKYCYGDEVAKWSQDVWEMLKSRLDKPYSVFDGSFNPEYPEHFLKKFIDDEKIEKYVQHYTIYDNPFLTKDFVSNLEKEYEGTVFYNRYILGEWARAEGLIYPMYDKALASIEDYYEDASIEDFVLSIDYGTMNAFACLVWAKVKGVYWAVDGYYYSGRDTGKPKTDEEYADDIVELCKPIIDKYESLYGKGFKKIKTIIDPSAASFITLMKKKGYFKVMAAVNAVLDGIRDTASAMQRGLIKIDPKIKEWQDEAKGYVWDEKTETEDRPIKVKDHCLVGNTMVMTEEGNKPIKDLVGTKGKVWSYNTQTEQKELKPYYDCRLTQKKAKIIKITCDDGRIIRCSEEHPILTERGYVIAKYLKETDKIIDITVKSIGIKKIEYDGVEDVYNMEVSDNHNFAIENGLIVHNCMDATRYLVSTLHIARHKHEL